MLHESESKLKRSIVQLSRNKNRRISCSIDTVWGNLRLEWTNSPVFKLPCVQSTTTPSVHISEIHRGGGSILTLYYSKSTVNIIRKMYLHTFQVD